MQGGRGEGRQRRSSTEGWKQDLSCPFLSFVFPEGPSLSYSSHGLMYSPDPSCQSFTSMLS